MSPTSPRSRTAPTGAVLRQIREALDLTQPALATRLDVTPGTISDWERGDSLRPTKLYRFAQALGVPPQVVDALLAAHQLLRQTLPSDLPIPLDSNASTSLWAAATSSSGLVHGFLLDVALSAQVTADRQAAAQTWALLSAAADVDRAFLIEKAPGVATWALVERLAAESTDEAPDRPETALHLARLALRSAELAPVSEALRRCLLGYAHAHIGNAHRVLADFRSADADFVRAREFWTEGLAAPAGLLSEARIFDLEASLRRDQRQLDRALVLIDRALALVPAGPNRGRLYINLSAIYEQQGTYQASLEALRAATPWIDATSEPWLYAGLLFNLCVNFVNLSRYTDALEILHAVRERFLDHGNDLDLIRLDWLGGRIQEGLGDPEGAIATIDQVRSDLTAKERFYDAALACLDLAALYLRTDRTLDTRDLTRQMTAVFRRLGIEREEFAAVRLFLQAAEHESATVEMARRAAATLRAVRRASGVR